MKRDKERIVNGLSLLQPTFDVLKVAWKAAKKCLVIQYDGPRRRLHHHNDISCHPGFLSTHPAMPPPRLQPLSRLPLALRSTLNPPFSSTTSTTTTTAYQARRWETYSSDKRAASKEPGPRSDPNTAPAPTMGDSEMVRSEGPESAITGHQPDFHAPIDHGTS